VTLTPSCLHRSATLKLVFSCRWNCPRHQSTRDWWFVRSLLPTILSLPAPRPSRPGGHATTPGKDGSAERIRLRYSKHKSCGARDANRNHSGSCPRSRSQSDLSQADRTERRECRAGSLAFARGEASVGELITPSAGSVQPLGRPQHSYYQCTSARIIGDGRRADLQLYRIWTAESRIVEK
jgi:hypothetical protein